jgi:hypothetical protein
MEQALEPHAELNKTQRRLTGAYFLHEYSFEASALFNPSIVRYPDQAGAPENACRFILSLRAVGEGHISSLTFPVRHYSCGRKRNGRSDRTSGVDPEIRSRTSTSNGDDVEVIFRDPIWELLDLDAPSRILKDEQPQPVLEANSELTRSVAHQMYVPTLVVFSTGVADGCDHYIVASREADLACRIIHMPKALFS